MPIQLIIMMFIISYLNLTQYAASNRWSCLRTFGNKKRQKNNQLKGRIVDSVDVGMTSCSLRLLFTAKGGNRKAFDSLSASNLMLTGGGCGMILKASRSSRRARDVWPWLVMPDGNGEKNVKNLRNKRAAPSHFMKWRTRMIFVQRNKAINIKIPA